MRNLMVLLFSGVVLYIVCLLLDLLLPVRTFWDLAIFCAVVLALATLIGRAFKK